MRRRAHATIGFALILVATQGCAGFDVFLENLFIAAGRVPPPGQPVACSEDLVTVSPGQCTSLQNPCTADRRFVAGDSFAFDAPPPWLRVETIVNGDFVSRAVCATLDAPAVLDTFPFTYVGARPQAGALRLTTVQMPPLIRSLTATPRIVQLGQSTQLEVVVEGGALPYRFAWAQSSPEGSAVTFNDPTLQRPTATATASRGDGGITFTVAVTDSVGQTAEGTLTAAITPLPLRVNATATPSTVTLGDSTQLRAIVEGGAPPLQFRWSPIFDLDPDRNAQNPVAIPDQTTTYQVEVSDSFQSATASVTVMVILPPSSDQVDLAVTVTGLPDPVVRNTILTYTITVTNNGPATATNVTLRLSPPTTMETNSPTTSQGTCQRVDSRLFDCAIGTLTNGATVTLGLEGFPFTIGTISFGASASSDQFDSNFSNNFRSQMTTVIASPPPN